MSAEGIDLDRALDWVGAVHAPIADVRELHGGWTSTMLALTSIAGEELVLRLMTREPWRTHGAALTTRESHVQHRLADTEVPAPSSLALDADGEHCGHPAHLMTLLPGRLEPDRVGATSLERLAATLATIHAIAPTSDVRAYQSWAFEAKYVVPEWSADPGLWEAAFDLLRTDAPSHEPTFIHRDFQPRNVLWADNHVAGVVDWVETSIGPAWLDVAHCSTNLAIHHGDEVADGFADAYVARTGVEPVPYVDVMDVVGFLPPAGRAAFITDRSEQERLEERLRTVLGRV